MTVLETCIPGESRVRRYFGRLLARVLDGRGTKNHRFKVLQCNGWNHLALCGPVRMGLKERVWLPVPKLPTFRFEYANPMWLCDILEPVGDDQ